MASLTFPPGFVWGAATSSYQIEGAANEGGKAESIWDRFAHTPGKIRGGATGDVACDHYHRFVEDVALMRKIGLKAYRFSTSWPRIVPDGRGRPNPDGIDFYARLVDALLEAGITPFLTLYHWDLPQALQDRGGFEQREIADHFADYAEIVGRALGDRVKHFITLNEPQIFGILGHLTGEHAPGKTDFFAYLKVSHHSNLAHGRSVQALRASVGGAIIGSTLQVTAAHPLTDSDADAAACKRFDGFFNRWYLDPLLLRRYPEDVVALLGALAPEIADGDLELIGAPLDFIGVNHYTRTFVRHADEVPVFALAVADAHRVPGARYTEMGWEIYPNGLYEVSARIKNEYGNPPVYITENGCALDDRVTDGRILDSERIEYLGSYLAALHRSIAEGADVRGYFVWSLLDNFEWQHGYDKRFGLVHVDYETLARTPKESAGWFARVIETGALDAG